MSIYIHQKAQDLAKFTATTTNTILASDDDWVKCSNRRLKTRSMRLFLIQSSNTIVNLAVIHNFLGTSLEWALPYVRFLLIWYHVKSPSVSFHSVHEKINQFWNTVNNLVSHGAVNFAWPKGGNSVCSSSPTTALLRSILHKTSFGG